MAPGHRALLDGLGVEAIEAFGADPRRRTYRVRAGDAVRVVKVYGEAPIGATAWRTHLDLIPVVAARSALVVPQVIDVGTDPTAGPYVVLENLEGDELRTRWSHDRPGSAGGRALGPADIDAAVDALVELASIAVDDLRDLGLDVSDPRRSRIGRVVDALAAENRITSAERDATHRLVAPLLDPAPGRPVTISNGDFRFPNLVVLDGSRPALVDWDGGGVSDSATERGVAHLWSMLFERSDLRRRLLDRARADLELDPTRFAAALAVHSIRIAPGVAAFPARLERSLDDLRTALDPARFENIWR